MLRGSCRAEERHWARSQETSVWSPTRSPSSLSLSFPTWKLRGSDDIITMVSSSSKNVCPPGPHYNALARMQIKSMVTQPAGRKGHSLPGLKNEAQPPDSLELGSIPNLYVHIIGKWLFPKHCPPVVLMRSFQVPTFLSVCLGVDEGWREETQRRRCEKNISHLLFLEHK